MTSGCGLRIQTKVDGKKAGGRLLAVMEYDSTDQSSRECIDSDGGGDTATFLVTCTHSKLLKKEFLCVPSAIDGVSELWRKKVCLR